jgi:hypothetical protein
MRSGWWQLAWMLLRVGSVASPYALRKHSLHNEKKK